jgi:hypothetical protein
MEFFNTNDKPPKRFGHIETNGRLDGLLEDRFNLLLHAADAHGEVHYEFDGALDFFESGFGFSVRYLHQDYGEVGMLIKHFPALQAFENETPHIAQLQSVEVIDFGLREV